MTSPQRTARKGNSTNGFNSPFSLSNGTATTASRNIDPSLNEYNPTGRKINLLNTFPIPSNVAREIDQNQDLINISIIIVAI